jgi:P4 family phage/plasmid primase-like protien
MKSAGTFPTLTVNGLGAKRGRRASRKVANTQRAPINGAANSRTPNRWFAKRFPQLETAHGEAVFEKVDEKKGSLVVADLCEDFLAATLGMNGTPESPVIFMPVEERFYGYEPDQGIYRPALEPKLAGRLSHLLLQCAMESHGADVGNLKFKLRDSSRLKGVLQRAQGVLAVDDHFFETELTEFIPCGNGVLRLKDMNLLPFSPGFRRRNKLAVDYHPNVRCPMFLETLLGPALEGSDIDLLQRWCGMALIGTNLAQKIMVITGTAGGGKGTLIRAVTGLIGHGNVASLRTRHLQDRFELGRLLGKTVLYGADVPRTFFNTEGATVLKSLTGGDPVTVEFKGSNAAPEIVCRFNAVVTCNSVPKIRLEGDGDAWQRRLLIVSFKNKRPKRPITDLSEQILAREGSGVLNWILDGLHKLRAEGWRLDMTSDQRRVVDDLLGESDSATNFVRDRLCAAPEATLTATACYTEYVRYCAERRWRASSRKIFGNVIGELIASQFGLSARHDIDGGDGKRQRGWKGVRIG